MTIYQIKNLTQETAPHFFTRSTLKFLHQTMRDFKVYKQQDGRYLILAPMRNRYGRIVGQTSLYFNPANNKLEQQ